MSYALDFVVARVPNRKGQAWDFLEDLQDRYEDDRSPAHPKLAQLVDVLLSEYPCLTSYADGDPEKDNCPWADGPMINNFAGEMGMVAIKFSRVEAVLPFVVESALALGITVMDGQTEAIHRPK